MVNESETEPRISATTAQFLIEEIDKLITEPFHGANLLLPTIVETDFELAETIFTEIQEEILIRRPSYAQRIENVKKLKRISPEFPYAFMFFRRVDDRIDDDYAGLDGNAPTEEATVGFLREIAFEIKHGNYPQENQDPILLLFWLGLKAWGKTPELNEEVRQLSLYSIKHMLKDVIRSESGEAVNQDTLYNEHLLHTLDYANSLLFLALDIPWRVLTLEGSQVFEPAKQMSIKRALLQGLRSRHLKDDWNNGIKIIPLEVLNNAGLKASTDYETIANNPTIIEWIVEEATEAKNDILKMRLHSLKLLATGNLKAFLVINFGLLKNMEKIRREIIDNYNTFPVTK